MTQHEEELMHRAKVVTLWSAELIDSFCKLNKIGVDDLTNFYLKHCRQPDMKECDFIAKYGYDKFSILKDAFRDTPTIAEISNALSEKTYDPNKVITIKKSSACGPTTSQPIPAHYILTKHEYALEGSNDGIKWRLIARFQEGEQSRFNMPFDANVAVWEMNKYVAFKQVAGDQYKHVRVVINYVKP